MKNSFLLLFITGITLVTTSAFATDTIKKDIYESKENTRFSLKTKDTVEIGLQSYWYKYEEEVDGDFFMSTTGQKYGLSLTGIKNVGNDVYVVADIRCATGDVEYKSASGIGDVSDHMYEARLLVGAEKLTHEILWSSFIGVGYRYLFNDLRDLGSGGYRRESQYIYIPIGITHRFRVHHNSRISTTLEYDYLVQGKQKSYISDVGPAYAAVFGDPVNDQNHGHGIRFSTSYEEEHWSAGVFFNYWKIEDSDMNVYIVLPDIIGIYEPENKTKEIGLQIKYRF